LTCFALAAADGLGALADGGGVARTALGALADAEVLEAASGPQPAETPTAKNKGSQRLDANG
jgi:hypothetical protein